ncbi:hypothetical protein GBA65_20785 [Rubrobacter marinus]|uniref:HTH luxR-type domain-containing protein n=1 Tax=Rubrobacter marinus TaxID=2653852 RepID=A0A6G8Q290_9ACTN|nr:response regulator transcription factor [Rubrobacter marinus]QIN80540.1 hypothetical protein GBA65_20785 [Rubrobacter marinus]
MLAAGLARILSGRAKVYIGEEAPEQEFTALVVYAEDAQRLAEELDQARKKLGADAPVLVMSLGLDLPLAWSALKAGARGYIHAAMRPEQIVRAVDVAEEGKMAAPRSLLEHLILGNGASPADSLSPRQREILSFVCEGAGNARIARELYLSESTVKQHLRAAYKTLGVRSRAEAARLLKDCGCGV